MSIFTDDERENSNGLEWFGDYHRWGVHQNSGGNWDNYDPYSKKILELKENNSSAESYFFNLLSNELGQEFAIAVVPSHNPLTINSSLKRLAQRLATNNNRVDATNCLIRTRLIPKLAHTSGIRTIDVHYESIEVRHSEVIKNQDVLVIDDVVTSRNSLRACWRLLMNAEASRVRCAALGNRV